MGLVLNLHEQVGYNGTDGGTHGCTMYLFIIFTLEEKTGIFEAEFQQCNDVINGHASSVMYLCLWLQLLYDYGDGRLHRNRWEKGFHII